MKNIKKIKEGDEPRDHQRTSKETGGAKKIKGRIREFR